ncbi:hypothetical protein ES703_61071 [subsurface metagenome]
MTRPRKEMSHFLCDITDKANNLKGFVIIVIKLTKKVKLKKRKELI